MSPNNVLLSNVVSRPKLLNNPFTSWFFTNLDLLLPHTPHFDKIYLPIFVLKF